MNLTNLLQASKTINSWVEGKTNNKIKDLISADSLNEFTKIVLVNAIYFKGKWKDTFDESRTFEDDFFVSKDTTVKVKYMTAQRKYAYHEDKDLKCTILKVPYQGDRLSMLFFLPFEGEDFANVEKKFASFDFQV